jgi:predicted ArsR family transcriptional regulator
MSANEIADKIGLTHVAVRSQLSTLIRLGLIEETGTRASATRPITLYGLKRDAESALSQAYAPFLAHLLKSLESHLTEAKLEKIMRSAGSSFAAGLPRANGSLAERAESGRQLLTELGALVHVESQGDEIVIRGHGCLLAEAVRGRPFVCLAMETLLSDYLSLPVTECCDRGERSRCCFRISAAA